MGKNPNYVNAEGYADPTAFYGSKEVIKQQTELDKKVHSLVHCIRDVANLAGFEVVGRITFKHKKSGKEFR